MFQRARKAYYSSDLSGLTKSLLVHALVLAVAVLGFGSLSSEKLRLPDASPKSESTRPVIAKLVSQVITKPEQVVKSKKHSESHMEITDKPTEPEQAKSNEVMTEAPFVNRQVSLVPPHRNEPNILPESQKTTIEIEPDFTFNNNSYMERFSEPDDANLFYIGVAKDLKLHELNAYKAIQEQALETFNKSKTTVEIDLDVRKYLSAVHERMERLAINVECDSFSGGALAIVSSLLTGTFSSSGLQISKSANGNVSMNRVRCRSAEYDAFIQRRLNKNMR